MVYDIIHKNIDNSVLGNIAGKISIPEKKKKEKVNTCSPPLLDWPKWITNASRLRPRI